MLIAFHIRKLLIPPYQAELLGVLWTQPPVICKAFQIKAIIAAIWALNFHTSIYILPKQSDVSAFAVLIVRLSNATRGYFF